MTASEFNSGEWVERLAEALTGLAEAPEPFADRLEEGRATHGAGVVNGGGVDMVPARGDVLLALYQTARFEE